ncbi:hypothetical protein OESDEN_01080 [Oesophagostomum dentatum]|uniref:Uncharacterized protein n=1 Tax=Oesophagostomum dentatum TaxID=61180 RepID=A0A0B1TNT5_OESDE|nr:hypothetical protein OESDEN_01080 [Oesophagostomum dentatum]
MFEGQRVMWLTAVLFILLPNSHELENVPPHCTTRAVMEGKVRDFDADGTARTQSSTQLTMTLHDTACLQLKANTPLVYHSCTAPVLVNVQVSELARLKTINTGNATKDCSAIEPIISLKQAKAASGKGMQMHVAKFGWNYMRIGHTSLWN